MELLQFTAQSNSKLGIKTRWPLTEIYLGPTQDSEAIYTVDWTGTFNMVSRHSIRVHCTPVDRMKVETDLWTACLPLQNVMVRIVLDANPS